MVVLLHIPFILCSAYVPSRRIPFNGRRRRRPARAARLK